MCFVDFFIRKELHTNMVRKNIPVPYIEHWFIISERIVSVIGTLACPNRT